MNVQAVNPISPLLTHLLHTSAAFSSPPAHITHCCPCPLCPPVLWSPSYASSAGHAGQPRGVAHNLMWLMTLGGRCTAVSATTAPLQIVTLMPVYFDAVSVSKIQKSNAAKLLNLTVVMLGDEENCVIALNISHQLCCPVSCKLQSHPHR